MKIAIALALLPLAAFADVQPSTTTEMAMKEQSVRSMLQSMGHENLAKAWFVSGKEELSTKSCVTTRSIQAYSKPTYDGHGVYRSSVTEFVGEAVDSLSGGCGDISSYNKHTQAKAAFGFSKVNRPAVNQLFDVGDGISDNDLLLMETFVRSIRNCKNVNKEKCKITFNYISDRELAQKNLDYVTKDRLKIVQLGNLNAGRDTKTISGSFMSDDGNGVVITFGEQSSIEGAISVQVIEP